jgi:hypothetical protein
MHRQWMPYLFDEFPVERFDTRVDFTGSSDGYP